MNSYSKKWYPESLLLFFQSINSTMDLPFSIGERDFKIIHRYFVTDITYRKLADEYELSLDRIKQIINKGISVIMEKLAYHQLENIFEKENHISLMVRDLVQSGMLDKFIEVYL